MRFWSLSGSLENWDRGISSSVWGVEEKHKGKWDRLSVGDILLFYVSKPVSGIIGVGIVENKFEGKEPLWPRELKENRVIWRYRFEFKVLYSLPQTLWKERKISIVELKISYFSALNSVKEEAAKLFFEKAESVWNVKIPYLEIIPIKVKEEKPKGLHEELKEMVRQIGEWEGFMSEKEYSMDSARLDVVWRSPGVVKGAPKYIFEIETAGEFYRTLSKLKHAYDLWAFPKLFIVIKPEDRGKVDELLSGTFHEIRDKLVILTPDKIEKRYKIKKEDVESRLEFGLI
jgi:predicted RNA-binding protein